MVVVGENMPPRFWREERMGSREEKAGGGREKERERRARADRQICRQPGQGAFMTLLTEAVVTSRTPCLVLLEAAPDTHTLLPPPPRIQRAIACSCFFLFCFSVLGEKKQKKGRLPSLQGASPCSRVLLAP